MIEVNDHRIFHLYNEKISYVFYVLKNNHLGHLYFGKRLPHLDQSQIDYFITKENKAAGTVKFFKDDSLFTLHDTLQVYPVYGTTDFKEGAIEIFKNDEPLYLNFEYENYVISEDKEKIPGLPSARSQQKSKTLKIVLCDHVLNIQLEQYFTIYQDSGVITRYQKITNLSQEPIVITKAMSVALDLPSSDYQFVHLSGAWLKERHVKKSYLNQGIVSVGSIKGASGHQQNPFVALESTNGTLLSGDTYGFNFIYSGNFLAQVEVDEWDRTRVMLGIHPKHFGWNLDTNNSFYTPEALMSYSENGLSGLSQENASFIQNHIIAPQWQNKVRPIVFNSWEAMYFNFDEDQLYQLAKQSQELGMECFVIDDGWFSHRDNDRSSLGDWYVNTRKFSNGIKAFSKKINALGMQLGIWFEPEMISPDSLLYQQHPDWVVRPEKSRYSVGRGQYVLDFANPEVVTNIFNQMCKIIEEGNIQYIKWDMNRNITEAFSPYLKSKGIRQTEFFHRYVLGLYHLYEQIIEKFPNILIEGCAGGGGRYDLGILYYSPQIWVSDDSDAIERLKIQFGTSLGYPINTLSNHVSAVPNHQVDRYTSLDMRYHVALFGSLGYELDLNALTHEEKETIKQQIKEYKKYRSLINEGVFYHLKSPFDDEGNEVCIAICNHDQTESLVGFYRILAKPNCSPCEYLKIPFVNDESFYQINNEIVLSGAIIKHIGVLQPYQFNGANHATAKLKGDFQSCLIYIKKIMTKE